MATESPKTNDIPLEVALDVLYARHNGAPFSVNVFEWAWGDVVSDTVKRALLSAVDRRSLATYGVPEEKHERCGWTISFYRDPNMFDIHIKLTPPKEKHEPATDRNPA